MSNDRYETYAQALEDRKQRNKYRHVATYSATEDSVHLLLDGKRLINACSNDYLNLSVHPEVIAAAAGVLDREGLGATASRLVSGGREIHAEFEQALSKYLQRERSLLFSSGFLLNVSLIPALVGRSDHVFIDRLCHHSLYQGVILSGARIHRFKHNDLDHLATLLAAPDASTGRRWIITEGTFSMDGDSPDLGRVCALADAHDAMIYVDEAHSFGIAGPSGRGFAAQFPRIDLIGTMFGKAMGGSGAAITCNSLLADYIVNSAGGFIYSTALPMAVVGGLSAALGLLGHLDAERAHVHTLSHKLRMMLQGSGYDVPDGNSPIIPVLIGTEADTLALQAHLVESGVLAGAIRPPTVPPGGSRIRLTLTAAHTSAHIDHIHRAFHSWKREGES